MLKLFFTLFLACLISLSTLLAEAETIYLKDGQVIKAKITKNTGYSVQIMEGNFPKSYPMSQIDRIEPDEPPPGTVDPAEPGAEEPLTDQKKELIIRLMDANGARESMTQIFAEIVDKVPPEAKEGYRKIFKVDEIISRLVPIYAKHYTTQELQEIIAFYKSPLGQKHIQTTPVVMKETMTETVKYFQDKLPGLGKSSSK